MAQNVLIQVYFSYMLHCTIFHHPVRQIGYVYLSALLPVTLRKMCIMYYHLSRTQKCRTNVLPVPRSCDITIISTSQGNSPQRDNGCHGDQG